MKDSTDTTARQGSATDFRTAFAALALEMKGEEHPTDDELVLYHERGLPAERHKAVKEHLLSCRECFALGQDLRAFAEAEHGTAQAPTDLKTAAFFRALRPRLREIEGRTRQKRWNGLAALAAAFSVAALGLSFWAASQQRTITALEKQITQLSGIQANVASLTLRSVQRDGSAAEREIRSHVATVVFLTPETPFQATAYEVRILDAAGSPVRTVADLEEDPDDGTLSFLLLPGRLPPGRYQVELYADGDRIQRHEVKVVSPVPPP